MGAPEKCRSQKRWETSFRVHKLFRIVSAVHISCDSFHSKTAAMLQMSPFRPLKVRLLMYTHRCKFLKKQRTFHFRPLFYLFICLLIYLFTHLLIYLLAYLLIYLFTYLLIYSFTHLLIYLLTYLVTHLRIYLFTFPLIRLFIYLFCLFFLSFFIYFNFFDNQHHRFNPLKSVQFLDENVSIYGI